MRPGRAGSAGSGAGRGGAGRNAAARNARARRLLPAGRRTGSAGRRRRWRCGMWGGVRAGGGGLAARLLGTAHGRARRYRPPCTLTWRTGPAPAGHCREAGPYPGARPSEGRGSPVLPGLGGRDSGGQKAAGSGGGWRGVAWAVFVVVLSLPSFPSWNGVNDPHVCPDRNFAPGISPAALPAGWCCFCTKYGLRAVFGSSSFLLKYFKLLLMTAQLRIHLIFF